jgi:hypothetical protein
MAFNRPPNDRSLTFKEIATDARIPLDEVNMNYKLYGSLLNLDVFHKNGKSIGQYFITLPLSCFVFHLPNLLLTPNFVYPTLFSSVPPPAINYDRSLILISKLVCHESMVYNIPNNLLLI